MMDEKEPYCWGFLRGEKRIDGIVKSKRLVTTN